MYRRNEKVHFLLHVTIGKKGLKLACSQYWYRSYLWMCLSSESWDLVQYDRVQFT